MAKNTHIEIDTLKQLSDTILEAAGLSPENASASTKILVEADMMGIPTHGVIRIPVYTSRLRSGGINAKATIKVDRRTPSLALVDGDNALGTVVGTKALHVAMEMAVEAGIAYVGCRNSSHFGALAPYAFEVCEAGFIMISGTNASTTMPPWGGTEVRIGNNPFSVAAPSPNGQHFILDMAMSVAARGKIRSAQKEGVPIPEGWAVNAKGQPTTDPSEALAGFLVPFGAHKGSGMSMAVDMLSGVLTGARFLTDISSWVDHPDDPQGIGHFFLLLDPARLLGRDHFGAAMLRFQEIILGTPAQDSSKPVLLPGQLEQERRQAAFKNGVPIREDLLEELNKLAEEF